MSTTKTTKSNPAEEPKDGRATTPSLLAGRSIRRTYELPQPEAPVAVREYLLTTIDGERCCLLHWILREDIPIDQLTFALVAQDEGGDELEPVEVTLTRDELPPMTCGTLFAPQWALSVPARCSGIRVLLREVISGDYRYRVTPGGVLTEYAADAEWIYNEKAAKRDKLTRKQSFRTSSKFGNRTRGVWPIAVLALLAVTLVICLPYLKRVIDVEAAKRLISDLIARIQSIAGGSS